MGCFRLTVALSTMLATALGCVVAVDPVLRRRSAHLPILAVTLRPYAELGAVHALSCSQQITGRASMADAETRLRVAAYQLGADAIISEKCEDGGTDWVNNCDDTIKCDAWAIRWKGPAAGAVAPKAQGTGTPADVPERSDGVDAAPTTPPSYAPAPPRYQPPADIPPLRRDEPKGDWIDPFVQ
jgi:hypothetical protein